MMLELENISYTYPTPLTGKRPLGLHSINLQVREGENFGFLGHNGAGKTTTIKCILNLMIPTKGSIRIAGIDSRNPRARAVVGYLPEQPYFYDYLSVQESVSMYGKLAGIRRDGITRAVTTALDRVRLTDRKHQRLRTLSKGLVQRVALAQALVANPKLVILDEPFSGLDPLGRKEFREIFFELRRGGATLFMSSHVLSDVEQLCDRASILVHGELKGIFDLKSLPVLSSASFEIVVAAPPQGMEAICQLAKSYTEERGAFRLIFKDRAAAEQALRATLNTGFEVLSYQSSKGTLEDLFTSLVKSNEVRE